MIASHTDPLRDLARKLGMPPGTEPEKVQKKLMDTLGPMVRVALRRGVGQPALLRWLQQHLAGVAGASGESDSSDSVDSGPRPLVNRSLQPGETDELVRTLARLLLAPRRGASPTAETVLGA
jgi:hypothetical protein